MENNDTKNQLESMLSLLKKANDGIELRDKLIKIQEEGIDLRNEQIRLLNNTVNILTLKK